MPSQDFFARIALDHHPVGKDELYGPQPPALDPRFFRPSALVAPAAAPLSHEENLAQFHEALQTLRERYRPFLADFTPPAALPRPRLRLDSFQFRYEQEADRDFSRVLSGGGEWEEIKIPDYRGPIGKWTGFYRTTFEYGRLSPGKRLFVHFQGVDYIANVTLNGRFVGRHEGFFAPFEFDITDVLNVGGENVLVVEVQNDYPTLGVEREGTDRVDGDKQYAATGPGWDDPEIGWHHCPPGAGIYQPVWLEERAPVFVHDLFARPNIDDASIEAWVEVFNTGENNHPFELRISVFPRNFEGQAWEDIPFQVAPAGPGVNYYRLTIPMPDFRLWQPDSPWLYTLRASISIDGELADERDRQFGMRTFSMDEDWEPKGALYLNNRPIMLRGANEMGHLQRCVMNEDWEQLIDDILIAKIANMNYFRITQRPVQEDIYDYFDRLGMMHQCDYPLFGYQRRNQFGEGVKQAAEMERLIRSHPSSIMVSFINEPFPNGKYADQTEEALFVAHTPKGHRQLFRDELEAFFSAARKAIYIENPDRVIKNVEGDYDPPTEEGLSDFHCYTMWYTNHALPLGKLHRGYLPPIKKGWRTGCGEYGTEGLDNYHVMQQFYPREWLPEHDDEEWRPDRISLAQTHAMHGDWFEEQRTIRDWIRESQRHQALATTLMTDAFRRRADLIVSTAIHLLIDAWPAGWMKVLVGVDRVPKPSYFAFQKSLEPVRIHLRTDRFTCYGGEMAQVEVWTLNDTPDELSGCQCLVTLRSEDETYESFIMPAGIPPVSANYAGTVRFRVPAVQDRSSLHLDAALLDENGVLINQERLTLEAFEPMSAQPASSTAWSDENARNWLDLLAIPAAPFSADTPSARIVSSLAGFRRQRHALLDQAREGATVVVQILGEGEDQIEIDGVTIPVRAMNGVSFLARNADHPLTGDFHPDDFRFWYNAEKDYIDHLATSYLDADELESLLFSYQKPDFFKSISGWKRRMPVVGILPYGRGQLIFSTLKIDGRIRVNPILDRFLNRLYGSA